MLVTSIFSISLNVFIRLFRLGCQNSLLCCKGLNAILSLFSARGMLGLFVLMGLFTFNGAVSDRYGVRTAQLTLVITASQFHFLFYAPRTLTNIFALFIGMLFYTIKALKYGHCLNHKYNRPGQIFTSLKRYGFAYQKLCYILVLLNIEKSGEQD